MTIAVVDDDSATRVLLERLLRCDGHEVCLAASGDDALELVMARDPDLIVLDLGLPGRDGIDLLPELRRVTDAGILVLSGRSSDADIVLALRLEADDYVVKPFSSGEFLARCASILRRTRRRAHDRHTDGLLIDGDLVVDPNAMEARLGGTALDLRPKEFHLLAHLLAAPNRVHSRSQLLSAVWGETDGFVGEATVTEHVRRLRAKIDPAGADAGRIRTVRGLGYRYVERAGGTTPIVA